MINKCKIYYKQPIQGIIVHQKVIQNLMTPNQSINQPHSKYGDHQEAELLSLSGNSNQSINKNNPSRNNNRSSDNGQNTCAWSLCLGVLFFALFAFIVYRYANLHYVNLKPSNITTDINNLQPLNGNPSSQPNTRQQNPQNQADDLQSDKNFLDEKTSQQQTQQQKLFPTPYTIWLFSKSSNQDYTHNIEHYSFPGKSTIQRVTTQNYQELIKSKTVLKALKLVNILQLSQQQLQAFTQQLVMFTLLYENGGVIIGGDLILTEGMDERRLMKKVEEERQRFGMFLYSDTRAENIQDKAKTIQIDFENYFIAAGRNFWLFKSLITKMTSALQDQIASTSPSYQNLIKKYKVQFDKLLKLKLQEYNALKSTNKVKLPFLQHIKILSFGPTDSLNIAQPSLLNLQLPVHFQYLSAYSEQALQQLIGPMNPIVHLPSQSYSQFLTQLKISANHPILPDSFLYRHMLSFSSTYSNLKPLSIQTDAQKYAPWKLPKILWTFINKLNQKSPLHDYFMTNLINRAKQSQYELIVLTEETIQEVLDGKELHEIFSNFKNDQSEQNHAQNEQILSELVKWYVLKNYGGVFIDFGYFLLQNLNWISRIKSNQHLFNNIHKDPEVLMFHNHSAVQDWSVNLNSGIKIVHNPIYVTKGFVAAVKNTTFVRNQLNNMMKSLKKSENSQNLNPQTLQSPKQKKPYKIWSISSLLGGDKMNLAMNGQKFQCFDFKDTLSQFRQKYGSLGYLSELTTDATKQQMNSNLLYMDEDSIFNPFFVTKIIDKKEIKKVKSISEVSLTAQKVKK